MKIKLEYDYKYYDVYYVCLFLWSFAVILFGSTVIFHNNKGYSLIWFGIQVILLVKMAMDMENTSVRDAVCMWGLLGIAIISHYFSKSEFLYPLMFFVAAGKKNQVSRAVKSMFYAQCSVCVLTIGLYMLGIIGEADFYYRYDVGRIRYSFGFDHPNTFGLCMLQICAMIFYLYARTKEKWVYIVYLLCFVLTYFGANSMTSSIMIGVVLGSHMMVRMLQRETSLVYKCVFWMISQAKIMIPIVFLLCVIVAKGYLNISVSSRTFNSRIMQAMIYFKKFRMTPFGQKLIVDYSGTLFTLDNAYIFLILGMGVVTAGWFLFMYMWVMRCAAKRKEYTVLMLYLIYAVVGISETALIRFEFNFSLIFFSFVLWQVRKK